MTRVNNTLASNGLHVSSDPDGHLLLVAADTDPGDTIDPYDTSLPTARAQLHATKVIVFRGDQATTFHLGSYPTYADWATAIRQHIINTTAPAQPGTVLGSAALIGQRNSVVLAQQCLKDALAADNDADMNDAVNAARYWLNY